MEISDPKVNPEVTGNTNPVTSQNQLIIIDQDCLGEYEFDRVETQEDDGKRHRGWCIVINNPTEEDIRAFKALKAEHKRAQFERGKEGTKHLQGCFYLKNGRSFKGLKKEFPRAHFQIAKYYVNLYKYCCKEESRLDDEDPIEEGRLPEQGRRTDLEELAKKVKDGVSLTTIAEENSGHYIRYFRGLQALKHELTPKRNEKPYNTYIWGPAGAGKTRYVINKHGADKVYIKDGTHWWDGYKGEEVILVDDFNGLWPFRDLLRFLDWYAYQGQVKGGYVQIAPKYIYFTSDRSLKEVATQYMKPLGNHSLLVVEDPNITKQLLRRFDKIIKAKPKPEGDKEPIEEELEL